jgi:hypothetical protein
MTARTINALYEQQKQIVGTATDLNRNTAALQAEADELGRKIFAARKRLDLLEQPTSDGFSRVDLSDVQEARDLHQSVKADETLLRELQNILKARFAAETKRREAKERLEKWGAAQQRCRELRDEHERARAATMELHDKRDFLQKELQIAIQMVSDALANPPDLETYPAPEDFAQHYTLCNKLKRKQSEVGAAFRDVDTRLQRQILAMLEIAARLDGAMLTERNLRPPEAR